MTKRPTISTKCVAQNYAAPNERIVEIFDRETKLGCLIAVSSIGGRLVLEAYRGDPGVMLRIGGVDHPVSGRI